SPLPPVSSSPLLTSVSSLTSPLSSLPSVSTTLTLPHPHPHRLLP
ncbi:uncharacterized protein LOC121860024, partial [Homarus americanus]